MQKAGLGLFLRLKELRNRSGFELLTFGCWLKIKRDFSGAISGRRFLLKTG